MTTEPTTPRKGTPRPGNGGPRPGAGSKHKFGEATRPRSVRLTDAQADMLADLGGGSLSDGVHKLIAQHVATSPST